MRLRQILLMKILRVLHLWTHCRYLGVKQVVLGGVALSCFTLMGCGSSEDQGRNLKKDAVQVGALDAESQKGRALLDVALGQEGSISAKQSSNVGLVAKEALPYVGRYVTKINCDDAYVGCDSGEADFIVSLLPNGIAHRMIKHRGSITFTSNQQYRQDRWSYDPNVHQIILHRASGVDFFYDINSQKNIVMDLDKIANVTETNQQYFAEGNPMPMKAYVLEKIQTTSAQ